MTRSERQPYIPVTGFSQTGLLPPQGFGPEAKTRGGNLGLEIGRYCTGESNLDLLNRGRKLVSVLLNQGAQGGIGIA